MRNRIGLLAGMAALFGIPSHTDPDYRESPNTVRRRLTSQARRKSEQQLLIERNKARGLKEFDIEGRTIWAINRKNAVRKALNQINKEHT